MCLIERIDLYAISKILIFCKNDKIITFNIYIFFSVFLIIIEGKIHITVTRNNLFQSIRIRYNSHSSLIITIQLK